MYRVVGWDALHGGKSIRFSARVTLPGTSVGEFGAHRAFTPLYLVGAEQKIANRSLFDLNPLQAEQSLYISPHSAPNCHCSGAVI